MNSKTMALAGLACAALTACSSTPPRHWNPFAPHYFTRNQECREATCRVDVTVTTNASTGQCLPAVVPVVDMRAGPSGLRTISWTISTAGYEWSKEDYKYGIFIKSNPFDEFKNARITNGGKTLNLDFSNSSKGVVYEYGLTVRRDTGGKAWCDTLDPWLIS